MERATWGGKFTATFALAAEILRAIWEIRGIFRAMLLEHQDNSKSPDARARPNDAVKSGLSRHRLIARGGADWRPGLRAGTTIQRSAIAG
jgi:hypothetical protein